jgi:signal transduction histidine kinase
LFHTQILELSFQEFKTNPLLGYSMPFDFVILNLIQWLSAFLMLGLAFYSLKFRSLPPARALLGFFILCGVWAFFAAVIPHVDDFGSKILLNRMKMLSPTLLPFSIVVIAHTLHGGSPWPKWIWALFSATPLIGIALIVSPLHEHFIGNYRLLHDRGVDLLAFSNGTWFVIHNIQARIVTVISICLILTAKRNLNPYHRLKTWLINLAIFAPFLIDSLAVIYYENLRFLQLTPALLAASAFMMAFAIFRRNILDVIPFARSQILDHTPDLYFVFDFKRRLVDFNVPAQTVFGLPPGIMGASWDQVFGREPGLLDRIQSENPSELHWQKEDEFYDIIQRPLQDGIVGRTGFLIIFKNVSLQKKVELELKEINQMKTRLLAVMGHDLQGSLSGLALTAENLAGKIESYHPQDLSALLETMHFSARSCVGLIDQLLIWSKSELGVLRISQRNFEVETLVEETLAFLQPAIVDKNIQVSLASKARQSIASDFNLVQTVIRNLLANSIKFTPENGKIEIRIEDQKESLQISVLDSGHGIAPELEAKIFDLHKENHTGIGLYLCAEFIKRLGGKIWSESSQGRGGIFHFTIPKAANSPD